MKGKSGFLMGEDVCLTPELQPKNYGFLLRKHREQLLLAEEMQENCTQAAQSAQAPTSERISSSSTSECNSRKSEKSVQEWEVGKVKNLMR
ncbi:unnamed protein product [Ceratitis capitata]|uniref:(Mediterranean fruit fly) hypothetical protein n=1 Tax=Ceratitis capitata TaxID=7213 RepID=A0A811VHJ2_CERCA|nr:unnamed protein product [Ceratitis capitata]